MEENAKQAEKIEKSENTETQPTKVKKFDKILTQSITVIALLMVVLHLLNALSYIMASTQFINLHLGFAITLVFLGAAVKSKRMFVKVLCIVCTVISLVCIAYVHFNYIEILKRAWWNTGLDLTIGLILIVMVLVCLKLGFGWFMPILVTVVALYPLLGSHLPEPFTTMAYKYDQMICNLSIGLTSGIYSSNLRTSAEFVFLFVIFGSVLSATGVQDFFWELGKMMFKRIRSGPALMPVLNSALVGSITGSTVTNIMITGVYTIPLMKASGYKNEVAGAMEAAASSGGQIMPPVMGTIAFIMASYTGIPYLKIIKMAIIPALLFYLGIGIYAHLMTIKKLEREAVDPNNKGAAFFKEKVNYRLFFAKMPGFIIPLALIIILLNNNLSVMSTAFYAIFCLLILSVLRPKEMRPKIKDVIKGLVDGAKSGATVGIMLSAIGIILITFSGTGLAVKIGGAISVISGGTLIGVALIIWVMCVLFGMIGVMSVAYYMGAAFAAPILLSLGISLEATHFFLMLPCCFAVLTPPVATGCVVAARLADASYFKTCYETIRCAFVGFLLPFMILYAPSLLLEPNISTYIFWKEIIMSFVFVVFAQIGWVGYMKIKLNLAERIIIILGAVGAMGSLFNDSLVILITSIVLLVAGVALHMIRTKGVQKTTGAVA